jgi:hypothetical protein
MQEEEQEAATPEDQAETAGDGGTETSTDGAAESSTDDATEASTESPTGKAKGKRGADKTRRSHAERAMANLRSAKKGQREVSDPVERAQFLLAEANVLALLELANAISGSPESASAADEASESA